MDSITQAALGAAIGEIALGNKIGNKGAILGAAIATIPDLDVVLYLFYDKFEMLSIHRGYSHSILFSFIGAFLFSYFLKRFKWTKEISYHRLCFFSWVTLLTHMFLDAFTAYGTQLFLPFSDLRFGLDSINVIDPVYTFPLIIGLVFSLFIYRTQPNRVMYCYIGMSLSSIYLLLTLVVKSHVNNYFESELAQQNISYTSILTMPVGVANINWYGVAKTDEGIYMKSYSLLNNSEETFEYFPTNEFLLDELNPILSNKMRWFAKDSYTVEKSGDKIRIYNLQVDMRGIIKNDSIFAPTAGYFEVPPLPNGTFEFGSGAH